MSFSPSRDESLPQRPVDPASRTPASALGAEPVRIRKYPNRRLYDTSRSRHLTHDGVIALVAEGRAVQVTDSRSGADITNAVLLQIMIERDPEKLAAVPSELVIRAMRSDAGLLASVTTAALRAWGASAASTATAATAAPAQPANHAAAAAGGPRPAVEVVGTRTMPLNDASGRPKAKAKRPDAV